MKLNRPLLQPTIYKDFISGFNLPVKRTSSMCKLAITDAGQQLSLFNNDGKAILYVSICICPQCGRKFIPKNGLHRFCNVGCRNKLHNDRNMMIRKSRKNADCYDNVVYYPAIDHCSIRPDHNEFGFNDDCIEPSQSYLYGSYDVAARCCRSGGNYRLNTD
jgi:hypothetical protein